MNLILGFQIYFILVISSSKVTGTCIEEKLIKHLSPLGVNSPEAILSLATSHNISKTCRKVSNSLLALDKYLSICSLTKLLQVYGRLTAGVKVVYDYVCADVDFQTR